MNAKQASFNSCFESTGCHLHHFLIQVCRHMDIRDKVLPNVCVDVDIFPLPDDVRDYTTSDMQDETAFSRRPRFHPVSPTSPFPSVTIPSRVFLPRSPKSLHCTNTR